MCLTETMLSRKSWVHRDDETAILCSGTFYRNFVVLQLAMRMWRLGFVTDLLLNSRQGLFQGACLNLLPVSRPRTGHREHIS